MALWKRRRLGVAESKRVDRKATRDEVFARVRLARRRGSGETRERLLVNKL